MPRLTFVLGDGRRRGVNGAVGLSLLQVAQDHGLPIEGSCGGCLACTTCHIVLDRQDFQRLAEMEEDEADMLDVAVARTATSRLGCQVMVTVELEGLVVRLPTAIPE